MDATNDAAATQKKRLGGWLILVGLGVVFSPFRLLMNTLPAYEPLLQSDIWDALTNPDSAAYHPLWGPLLIGEITFNVGLFLASLYLIYLFFTRHWLFPSFYIGIVLSSLVFIPADAWLVSIVLPQEPMFDPDTTKEFVRTLIGALIWIPYMLMSQRVKETFVKDQQDLSPALPVAESN